MRDEVATSYLEAHYSLKHRCIAGVSHLFEQRVYTVRHGLLRGLKRKGGLGFLPQWAVGRTDDTAEARLFASLDLRGKVVYDVGGFEGLITMFFATRAKAVVVYEPNPSSRHRLEDNLRLNGIRNVTVRGVGVGAQSGTLELVYDPSMPGGATAQEGVARQVIASTRAMRREQISVVRIDDDVANRHLPLPDLAKIDVEGMELDVLRGMRQVLQKARPRLYIEMHGATADDKRSNARDVVRELAENGYADIVHVESGRRVTLDSTEYAAEGHLFCVGNDTEP
jgi:FkbM family methyltransferase